MVDKPSMSRRSPPRSPPRVTLSFRLQSEHRTSKHPIEITFLDLSQAVSLTQSTTSASQSSSTSKITKIEGLDKYVNLLQLNLAGNAIKTVENLSHLHHLQVLDLSRNNITNPGQQLGQLVSLKRLSLAGNFMTRLPKCLGSLQLLEVLDLSGNNISLLREFQTLTSLDHLCELSVLGNKVCELPHYREFVIFTLRSLSSLDTCQVRDSERQSSVSRFSEKDNSYEQLEESFRRTTALANTSKSQHHAEHAKLKELLRATQQLLEQRTSEWAYANERMTHLEQELAFYKIDHSDLTTRADLASATTAAAAVSAKNQDTLDAASTSLLALLSPVFDWEKGHIIDLGNSWKSPASSPSHSIYSVKYEDVDQIGLMDAVVDEQVRNNGQSTSSSSSATYKTTSEESRIHVLEQTSKTVEEMHHIKRRLQVEMNALSLQEEEARHALNDSLQELHAIDEEIHVLETLSSRIQNEMEHRRRVSSSQQQQKPPTASQMFNNDVATTNKKETAGERFGTTSQIKLDEHKNELVNALNRIDQLTKFADVLELKMTATRDLLVCRTEALIEDSSAASGMASELEDAYKELSSQVQIIMVEVGMKDSGAGTFSKSSSSSLSGVVGGGIYDNGITVLTREVQEIALLQERVQQNLLNHLNMVSEFEAAVLNQAQVVEDEGDLVQDVEREGGVPSPRKRMRSSQNSFDDQDEDKKEQRDQVVDGLNDTPPQSSLSFTTVDDPSLHDPRPTSPASAMRQTLSVLNNGKKEDNTLYTGILPRLQGEQPKHHHDRVVERARLVIQKRQYQKNSVITLEREHNQIHMRLRKTENDFLKTCLDICKAEATVRRMQVESMFKWVHKVGAIGDSKGNSNDEVIAVNDEKEGIKIRKEKDDTIAKNTSPHLTTPKNQTVSTPKALHDSRNTASKKSSGLKSEDLIKPVWNGHKAQERTFCTDPPPPCFLSSIKHVSSPPPQPPPSPPTSDATQFHFALRQLLEAMKNNRTLYGKQINSPDQFFDAVDQNNDGIITTNEFQIAMKRMDVELSSIQVRALLSAMSQDGDSDESESTISYFELVNALRVEARLVRQEENQALDLRRREEYERRRVEIARTRQRELDFQKEDQERKDKEEEKREKLRRHRRSAVKKIRKSLPPSMERALRKRILHACATVGGVNWRRVFRCHEEKKVFLSLESFRSGVRRDGHLTIKLFDNISVRDVFNAVDANAKGEIGYDAFILWLNDGNVGTTSSSNEHTHVVKLPAKREIFDRQQEISRSSFKESKQVSHVINTSSDSELTNEEVELLFMNAVRAALSAQGKDDKRIELVIGSLQFMLDNGQGEKARTIAGKAFLDKWPNGLIFPPDLKSSSTEYVEQDENLDIVEHLHGGNNDSSAATKEKRRKKSNNSERMSRINTSSSKKNRGLFVTSTTAFGGGRSLPWEHPPTPTMRDEFGNYYVVRTSKMIKSGKGYTSRSTLSKVSSPSSSPNPSSPSPSSTLKSEKRGTYNGSFSETSEQDAIDDNEGNFRSHLSSHPKNAVFVAASRRRTLFGRESTSVVINAKTSKGMKHFSKIFAERKSKQKAYEKEKEKDRLQRERDKLESSTNIEERNADGEILFDVGAISDPHFVKNLSASSPDPLNLMSKEAMPLLQTPIPVSNTSSISKKSNIEPIQTTEIDLSIFGGSKFNAPTRNRGREERRSSAVKKDMHMRERGRYSSQRKGGIKDLL
jgi:hypothetical protein